MVWRGRQRSLSDSNVENIYYRTDLEWADGLLSNRTSVGEGALGGDAAFEVLSWRARETPSSCSAQAGQAVRCAPGATPPELCPGGLPWYENARLNSPSITPYAHHSPASTAPRARRS